MNSAPAVTPGGAAEAAPVAIYFVDEDQADDPEASCHDILTAEEIMDRFPDFGALFVNGDGTESLTFCHELYRLRIRPVGEPS
jgi:hypothetical protein